MKQVLKREGGTEEWDKSKLVSSIVNSGVTAEEAEKIAGAIELWAQNETANGPIPTAMIRAKVMEAIQLSNPTSATTYSSWVKQK